MARPYTPLMGSLAIAARNVLLREKLLLKATGTYNQTPQPAHGRAAHAQRADGSNRQKLARRGEPTEQAVDKKATAAGYPNLMPVGTLGDDRQELARPDKGSRGGTRTRTSD